MTDTPVLGVTTTVAFNDYFAQEAARDRRRAELLPANMAVVFNALASVGIVNVIVVFEGCGDSGQIESTDAQDATGEVALPNVTVEIASPSYADDSIDRHMLPLAEAIATMAYDLLSSTHGGWENNDGAYGEFTFDVATRVISLDHNERYVAVESYSHEF